jgi:hypothetical protein
LRPAQQPPASDLPPIHSIEYDVEIRKIIRSTNAWVILSQRSDQGVELVFCVLDGVADVTVWTVLIGCGVCSLGVSCVCSRVGSGSLFAEGLGEGVAESFVVGL